MLNKISYHKANRQEMVMNSNWIAEYKEPKLTWFFLEDFSWDQRWAVLANQRKSVDQIFD